VAILPQALSCRLGIATRRDPCLLRFFTRPTAIFLWVGAIAACDLAEVLGSAVALNLLFGMPLLWGLHHLAGTSRINLAAFRK